MAILGNIFKKINRGLLGESQAKQFSVAGIKVKCPHCKSTLFTQGSAQLNTAAMSFLDLDWANASATVLECIKCGNIQWFSIKPSKN